MRALSVSIDRSALIHNYNVAKQCAGDASVFAVVKADAYGHGAVEVAKTLSMADAFAVVTTGEAMALRDAGIQQPILVLQGPIAADQLKLYVDNRLWPVIHDESQLSWFKQSLLCSDLSPWLKIDSGMGRLGFSTEQASAILNAGDNISWFGMLTHLASADDPQSGHVMVQANKFALLQSQFPTLKSSIANSAGIMGWSDLKADWLRPGLMLYGSSPFAHSTAEDGKLKPVMRVTAPVVSVKHLGKGETVGYAQSYHCPEDMPVAYVAAGYGDGLPRVLDQSATVSIQGKACHVIGRVSMDSMAIDVRMVKNVTCGDEVVFWGPEHPVEHLAEAASTISYELLTHIRGNRLYI